MKRAIFWFINQCQLLLTLVHHQWCSKLWLLARLTLRSATVDLTKPQRPNDSVKTPKATGIWVLEEQGQFNISGSKTLTDRHCVEQMGKQDHLGYNHIIMDISLRVHVHHASHTLHTVVSVYTINSIQHDNSERRNAIVSVPKRVVLGHFIL